MFKIFKEALDQQIKKMSRDELFFVNADKDKLWELYLSSFPEGTNPIYRKRTEQDCSCCKQFLRAMGNVVTVGEEGLVTIWDIGLYDEKYQPVADALSEYIKSLPIAGIFRSHEKKIGTNYNHEEMEDGVPKRWDHMYCELSNKYVLNKSKSIGDFNGDATADHDVLKRSLTEISLESCEMVIELISQNSLYRGEEHLPIINKLKDILKNLDEEDLTDEEKELFYWVVSSDLKRSGRIKNTVIGTLLWDISAGLVLEEAVKKFESKVAPENYKRSSALITKSMIKNAEDKVAELGIADSLPRRYAVVEDITVNNVIYADRSAKKAMGSVFDDLSSAVADNVPKFDKVQEVPIEKFIKDVLPTATSIELMVENRHMSNLVSIIAPENPEAPNILKWNNNFSWSYNGDVTDSMKERVKAKGGNVVGDLRFSIQWNDDEDNKNDLDAHCLEPNDNLIHYMNKGRRHPSSGMLDVDIVEPRGVAVENIIYTDKSKMHEGEYQFMVHNYDDRGGQGFTAEIEFDGKIFSFSYAKKMRNKGKVLVAIVTYSKANGFTIKEKITSEMQCKQVWGISTHKWNRVSTIMHSPNHWDENKVGNKHWFFTLEGCKNPEKSRGLYNEFLMNDLTEHRKVFEVLGSKMKAEPSENQLSGVGYSSTVTNSVICKVSGKTNRVIKIKF